MSLDVIAIVVLGVLMTAEIGVSLFVGLRWLREIVRTQRAIAGLIVQDSEKIQNLMRA